MKRLTLTLFALWFTGCEPPAAREFQMDERSLQLLRLNHVPSFRGLREEAGALIVFVHDDADRAAVVEVVPEADVRLRPARRDGPFTRTTPVSVDGMSFSDVDEQTNYLRYGLWKAAAIVPLQDELTRLGFRLDEVIVQIERPYLAL